MTEIQIINNIQIRNIQIQMSNIFKQKVKRDLKYMFGKALREIWRPSVKSLDVE